MGHGYSVFSDASITASVNKNAKMSAPKKLAAQMELGIRLVQARGSLKHEFEGFSYNDYKNLLLFATKQLNSLNPRQPYRSIWFEVTKELQSIVDEFAATANTNNRSPNCSEASDHISRSDLRFDGISMDGDGRVHNIPPSVPIPHPQAPVRGGFDHSYKPKCKSDGISAVDDVAAQLFNNRGEQNLTGMVNQSGFVRGTTKVINVGVVNQNIAIPRDEVDDEDYDIHYRKYRDEADDEDDDIHYQKLWYRQDEGVIGSVKNPKDLRISLREVLR